MNHLSNELCQKKEEKEGMTANSGYELAERMTANSGYEMAERTYPTTAVLMR